MPLGQSLQGAPAWWNQYVENLVGKSRQLAAEPYTPYGRLPPEKTEAIKRQIEQLIEQQKGNEADVIPFSITGISKPININPEDLKAITENEQFARKVYSSATGHQNISRDEIEDLRNRAVQKLEPYMQERERIQQERVAGNPELQRRSRDIYDRIERIRHQNHEIGNRRNQALQSLNRFKDERPRAEEKLREVNARIPEVEGRLRDVDSRIQLMSENLRNSRPEDRGGVQIQLNRLHNERAPIFRDLGILNANKGSLQRDISSIQEQSDPLEQEVQRLTSEREPILEENRRLLAEQRQVSRELHPELYGGNNAAARRSTPEDFLKRASIEREIKKLQEEQGNPRIAPMNEHHERAINMLERSFNDDTLKLSADELREAKKHNEREAVEPFIKSSLEGPSDEYMDKYVNDYTKDIRKALQDESEEEYIKKIAPKINLSFAQMGSFHSGARAKALKDSLLEHRTKLHRELAHLTSSARDKAMEHHELQKRREQSAANIMGSTTKSQRESARQEAELLRNNAVTKHGMSQMNIAALGQVARAKQEQQQHEIDVARQEHERQLLHPQEQLAREAAFVSGLPAPAIQSIGGQLSAAPAPPNLFNLGAGTLAALTSGIGQQQRQFKGGGSVRKKYADGGSIGSGDIGNEIRNIIREQGQADQTRLTEAREHNPLQSWLKHVGREMLSKPYENPLYNLSRGTANSMDHADIMRERAANLYDKIQGTKLSQYQVLAAYENMKDQNALHREKFLESKNFHQQQLSLHKQKNIKDENSVSHPLVNFDSNEFIPITSKKEKKEILDNKKSSEDILKELEDIQKLSKEYERYNENLLVSPRNPLIGGIASRVQGKYSNITQNKNMRKAAVTKAALDSKLEKFKINMETKMRKGVLPEGMRQFMEEKEVFPSSHEPLDIYNKKLQDLLEETKNVYDASKASLKYNIHLSPYDLEKMKGEYPSQDIMPTQKSGGSWYEQLGGTPTE